jgi:hypothetical protein
VFYQGQGGGRLLPAAAADAKSESGEEKSILAIPTTRPAHLSHCGGEKTTATTHEDNIHPDIATSAINAGNCCHTSAYSFCCTKQSAFQSAHRPAVKGALRPTEQGAICRPEQGTK